MIPLSFWHSCAMKGDLLLTSGHGGTGGTGGTGDDFLFISKFKLG
jgi:hypothetical protein